MTKFRILTAGLWILAGNVWAQNMLHIPPVLTGTTFNLNVQSGTQSFYAGSQTSTLGINGPWMAPTIIANKGDSITLNVTNSLSVRTTMHWHGFHVSAKNDGGPHQRIDPGNTWSPSFKIRNNASTFWYHPHGAGQTDPQVSGGLAGLFIIHDAEELALDIPHNYGQDDIPLVVQSKAFDELKQIAIATDMDTALFVNGTLHPYLNAPAQVIRFRILNGSSMRSFNFGMSNNDTMFQIGTDGGLLDMPRPLTRLILSPGERAELLINLTGMQGDTLFLKSYASELPHGIYGSAMIGTDIMPEYDENPLNGTDFNLLQLNIAAATATPVTTIPATLVPLLPFDPTTATNNRTIILDTIRLLPAEAPDLAEGPFGMNNTTFDMDMVNEVVYLNTTETWTLVNKTQIAHPFHIHDIQFNVIEKNGTTVPPSQHGWKDVILVMPGDTVKFLTKFETFADAEVPYMYHCHLLHHEDDGMMGSFTVIDTSVTGINEMRGNEQVVVYPNPAKDRINIHMPSFRTGSNIKIGISDLTGRKMFEKNIFSADVSVPTTDWANGIYILTLSDDKTSTVSKFIINRIP